jgi:hypothetical protein
MANEADRVLKLIKEMRQDVDFRKRLMTNFAADSRSHAGANGHVEATERWIKSLEFMLKGNP